MRLKKIWIGLIIFIIGFSAILLVINIPILEEENDMKAEIRKIIHRCDDDVGWDDVNIFAYEGDPTEKVEGAYSLNMQASADGGYMEYTISPAIDISRFTKLCLWNLGLSGETTGRVYLFTDAGNYAYWNVTVPATWTLQELALATPTSETGTLDLTNITKFRNTILDKLKTHHIDFIYVSGDVESKIANCYIWSPMYMGVLGTPPVFRPLGWDPYVPYTDWDKRYQLCRIRIKPTHKDYFIEGDIIEIQDDSSVCCFYGRIVKKHDRMTSYIIDAWGWGDELMESVFANAYTGSKTSEILEGQIAASNKSTYSGSIDPTTITMTYDVKIPTYAYIDLARYMERGVFWRVPGYDGKCYFDKDITDVNILPAEPLIYPAEYNFSKDTVGGNPAGWIVVETGGTVNVIASLDGHKKVVEMDDTDGANYIEMRQDFTDGSQTSGTVELWVQGNDVTKYIQIWLHPIGPLILIDADKIQYHYTAVWHDATGGGVSDDTWYHFKIVFDCATDTYDFYLNESLLDADIPFSTVQTGLTRLTFRTQAVDSNYKYYIDAIDYSWASGYSAGRNITPWSNYSKGIRFIGKKSYNLGVTRAHVWGTVNSKEQVNKISSLTTEEQEKGSFTIFPYIDLSLTNYTEVNQLATALKNIFSTDTLFINIRVQGKGFLQWGKRVNFKWNIKSILPTADDYMIVEWIYDAKNDRYLRFIISNNTVFEREFVNIQKQLGRDIVANAMMIDSQASESDSDGTVLPQWTIPQLRAHGCLIATGSYTGDDADNRQITIGFTPKYIIIMAEIGAGSWNPYDVHEDYTVWKCKNLAVAGVFSTDSIKIIIGGFEVNNSQANDDFNNLDRIYYYTAWG